MEMPTGLEECERAEDVIAKEKKRADLHLKSQWKTSRSATGGIARKGVILCVGSYHTDMVHEMDELSS